MYRMINEEECKAGVRFLIKGQIYRRTELFLLKLK